MEPVLSYTPTEIRGLLPSGWNLMAPGRYDRKRQTWEVEVQDPSDTAWPLVVDRKALDRSGGDRLGALRGAIDKLYREALG